MRITITAAVALLALAFTAEAGAAPQRLDSGSLSDPVVAVGSSGRAVSLLSDRLESRLLLRLARPGRGFGRPRVVRESVSRRGRALPQPLFATVGATGRAALLWTADDESQPAAPAERDEGCCRRLWAAVVDEAGRLRRAARLSTGPVDDFRESLANDNLAVVRGSRAAVAWRDRHELRVAVAGPRGRFGRPWRIRTSARPVSVHIVRGSARLVVFDAATGVLAELRRAQGRTRRLRLARLDPGEDVRAASTAAGHLLIVQQGYDRRRREGVLRIGFRRPGGRVRAANVRFAGLSRLVTPAVPALAPGGRGLIVAGRETALVFVAVTSRGGIGRPRPIPRSRPPELRSPIVVRAGSSGVAVVAAARFTRPGAQAVAWRFRLRGGPTRRFAWSPNAAYGIAAGVDGRGRALVAWTRPRGVYVDRLR